MTKRELIEALKDFDDDAQITIAYTEYMAEVGEPGVSFFVEGVQKSPGVEINTFDVKLYI